jgi:RHS repeat-associated protein
MGVTGQAGSGYLASAYDAQNPTYTYSTTSGLKIEDDLRLAYVGPQGEAAGPISATYTYTDSGRLATATIDEISETYTFDAAGNLLQVAQTEGPTTSFTYTENRLQSMTVTGQDITYFNFDEDQRWRTAQAPSSGVEDVTTDPDRTTYAYTGTGRLAEYVQYENGSAVVSATYSYDASGQRKQSVVSAGGDSTTTDFTYAGLALQSLSASRTGVNPDTWHITYLYDEYGRPYGGIYRDPASSDTPVFFAMVTTDRGDVVELLDVNGNPFAAYRYDAWGNPMGNTVQQVRYEQDDSLVVYPDPNPWTTAEDAGASGGTYVCANETGASVTIQFEGTYLAWIATKAADYGIANVTLDEEDPVPVDLYGETTLYQQSVWNTGSLDEGTHTVTIEWTDTKNELSTDKKIAVDAVEVMGLPGSGNVDVGVWAQATTDGESTVISLDLATDIAQRQVLRYASYCYDSESGMYYLSSRHYDPVTRQFLSKDLSRNDGEQSAYQYCGGNPIASVDPTGFTPFVYNQAEYDYYTKDMNIVEKIALNLRLKSTGAIKRSTSLEKRGGILAEFPIPQGGWKDNKTLPDVTDLVLNMCRSNAGEAGNQLWKYYSEYAGSGSLFWAQVSAVGWFGNAVAKGQMWDFKTLADYYGVKPSDPIGLFQKKRVSFEDVGNINYGFCGGYLQSLGIQFGVTVPHLEYFSVRAAKQDGPLFNKDGSYTEAGYNEYEVDHPMIELGHQMGMAEGQLVAGSFWNAGFYYAPPAQQ